MGTSTDSNFYVVIIKDECAAMTDNCAPNATCTNTASSFTCTCNEGYTGDGSCTGMHRFLWECTTVFCVPIVVPATTATEPATTTIVPTTQPPITPGEK